MDFDDVKKTHVLNGFFFVLKMKEKKPQGIRVGAHPGIEIQGRPLLPRRRFGPKKSPYPIPPTLGPPLLFLQHFANCCFCRTFL